MHNLRKITQSDFLSTRNSTTLDYILPHEEEIFHRVFGRYVLLQAVHGQKLGEAMEQGAETFHDNAPAEAIVFDQTRILDSVKNLRDRYRNSVVVEYPINETCVTLGSLCTISFFGDEPDSFYIVGNTAGYSNDTGVISLMSAVSPLGKLVIGTKKGDELTGEVNGREIKFVVQDFLHMGRPDSLLSQTVDIVGSA